MGSFSIKGLNHLGLCVHDMDVAKQWFVDKLKFKVLEDRKDMILLEIGRDIFAIKLAHKAICASGKIGETLAGYQIFDHYGFFAESPFEVDAFCDFLKENDVEILKGPYDRSDGRAVYFKDPCGLNGEYFYLLPN